MFFREWNVLVVDDDPDVLEVTRRALRNVRVYGLPVKVHTAGSKAEAINLLEGPLALQGSMEPVVAVAFVDVVMESNTSGLELCDYIRHEADGHSIQLFLRTGLPDVAPDRSVMDKYDISGYVTKSELTEHKLYSLVAHGVRQWFSSWYILMTEISNTRMVLSSGSRKEFLEAIGWFGEPGPQEGEAVTGFIFDKNFIVSDYPAQILPLYKRLDLLPPVIQTPDGHKLAVDELGNLLVKTVKTKTMADYVYVGESTMLMPRLLLDLTFKSGMVFSSLWKRITDEEKRPSKARRADFANVNKKAAQKPVKKIAKKAAKKKK